MPVFAWPLQFVDTGVQIKPGSFRFPRNSLSVSCPQGLEVATRLHQIWCKARGCPPPQLTQESLTRMFWHWHKPNVDASQESAERFFCSNSIQNLSSSSFVVTRVGGVAISILPYMLSIKLLVAREIADKSYHFRFPHFAGVVTFEKEAMSLQFATSDREKAKELIWKRRMTAAILKSPGKFFSHVRQNGRLLPSHMSLPNEMFGPHQTEDLNALSETSTATRSLWKILKAMPNTVCGVRSSCWLQGWLTMISPWKSAIQRSVGGFGWYAPAPQTPNRTLHGSKALANFFLQGPSWIPSQKKKRAIQLVTASLQTSEGLHVVQGTRNWFFALLYKAELEALDPTGTCVWFEVHWNFCQVWFFFRKLRKPPMEKFWPLNFNFLHHNLLFLLMRQQQIRFFWNQCQHSQNFTNAHQKMSNPISSKANFSTSSS